MTAETPDGRIGPPPRKFLLITVEVVAEVTDAAALRAAALENWDAEWEWDESGEQEDEDEDRALVADDDVCATLQTGRFDLAVRDSIDETPGLAHPCGISTTCVVELDAGTPEQAEAARRLHEDDPRAGYRRACPHCHRTGCPGHKDGDR